MVDYDEGVMYRKRGDNDRARPLFAAASIQFKALGMTGWLKTLEKELRQND